MLKELRSSVDDLGGELCSSIDDLGGELRSSVDDLGAELCSNIDDQSCSSLDQAPHTVRLFPGAAQTTEGETWQMR